MNETSLDRFGRRLDLLQPQEGYRFNEDALRLVEFFEATFDSTREGRLADLGCGVGVLGLWCLDRYPHLSSAGFDIDPTSIRLAQENASRLEVDNRFEAHLCDLSGYREKGHPLANAAFDVAIANPPFYSTGSGRINPDARKAEARHERSLPLEAWIGAAYWALKDGGALWCVYPAQRAIDLLAKLRAARMEPKTMQWLHADPNRPAKRILVLATKNGRSECKILPPMFAQDEGI